MLEAERVPSPISRQPVSSWQGYGSAAGFVVEL